VNPVDLGEILRQVVQAEASDLHLAVGLPPVVRIDGHLRNLEGHPELTANESRELIYSILNQDQRQKLESDWEVDLSYSLYGQARFRVNVFFHKGTLAAAFRLIPVNIKTIDDLQLPKVLHSFCHKPRGFVLVTGPTGSGKSTTLAAIIDEINETRSDHIVTIEDPIEFLHTTPKAFLSPYGQHCGRTPT
jgi:twitching motility protein PilT